MLTYHLLFSNRESQISIFRSLKVNKEKVNKENNHYTSSSSSLFLNIIFSCNIKDIYLNYIEDIIDIDIVFMIIK